MRQIGSIALLMGFSFLGGMAWMAESRVETKSVCDFEELEAARSEAKKSYLPFLNVSSLHCGIYTFAAGAKDGQQPHSEDEIYYIQKGKAKIEIAGIDHDLKPGSIVFVPAKVKHHFHSIEKELQTLVFFSKGPVAPE